MSLFALGMVLCVGAEPPAFRNLDFELADISRLSVFQTEPYLAGQGTVADLLPFWQLSYGGSDVSVTFLNVLAPEAGGESILSKEALRNYSAGFQAVHEGRFAMAFTLDTTRRFVLRQTGTVPLDAQKLEINVAADGFAILEARLAGSLIGLESVEPGKLAGDVSAFAGQTAELEFSMWISSPFSFGNGIELDGIRFAVPEPRTMELLLAAGICLAIRRPLRRKNSKLGNVNTTESRAKRRMSIQPLRLRPLPLREVRHNAFEG